MFQCLTKAIATINDIAPYVNAYVMKCYRYFSPFLILRFASCRRATFTLYRIGKLTVTSILLAMSSSFLIDSSALAVPKGVVDNTNSGIISGWALDSSTPTYSITVSIYMDGPLGIGKIQATFSTNGLRPDVNSALNTAGYHGFQWAIPQNQRKTPHIWFVYASNLNATPTLLTNSPAVYPSVSATMTGTSQAVFVYSKDACASDDIPDHPARAFRTSDGNVTLLASHHEARRAVGSNLDSVMHQCAIVHPSDDDPTFQNFKYYQWLQAPYTLDGKTVYMVTHNEWYGNIVKPGCNNDLLDGWISAVTLLVSQNGGVSYTRPLDYIVRNPTTPWNNNMGCSASSPTRYGDLGGSNIVYKDGYYYKFFLYWPEPSAKSNANAGWQCVMRSNNLASASSWYVFNGNSWIKSKTGVCASISSVQNLRSVTLNTYLNMYVGIQQLNNAIVFSLSRDLINWTAPEPVVISGINTANIAYPSLIDPNDTTSNFEQSGQYPYIFYTQFNNGTGANRDLMRFPLKFSIAAN